MDKLESSAEVLLGFRGGFFNKALRQARLSKGLTQKQLADLVREKIPGFNELGIGFFENLRKFPKPDVQQAIADILMIPVNELFPTWLQEMTQVKAIQEVPLESLSTLSQGAIKALQAFNPEATVDPEEQVIQHLLSSSIQEILEGLTDLERSVIKIRFGLDGKGVRSGRETALELGIDIKLMRQIEVRALRQLKPLILSSGWLETEPLKTMHMVLSLIKEANEVVDRVLVSEKWNKSQEISTLVSSTRRVKKIINSIQELIPLMDSGSRGWTQYQINALSVRLWPFYESLNTMRSSASRHP